MRVSIQNKINLDFKKVGDVESVDGTTRFISDSPEYLNIPEGVYLIVENDVIKYVGKFSKGSGKKRMNFGSRWLYTSKVVAHIGRSAYEIYHHVETQRNHLTKSLNKNYVVEIYVLSEDTLMECVDNHPLVSVDSTEIAIMKEFNLIETGWNEKR